MWGTVDWVEMLDYEVTTKDAREGILGAIFVGATGFDVTKFLARLWGDYGVPVS
jgi:hypothetical protein